MESGAPFTGRLDPHPWEQKENPQTYDLLKVYGEHPKPAQHILGVVGGNAAPYQTRQIQVDTESDLRGITRANTFCPQRQHQPSFAPGGINPNATTITRKNPKQTATVQVATKPLPQTQMWAYPATLAPEPFVIETCLRPEKY